MKRQHEDSTGKEGGSLDLGVSPALITEGVHLRTVTLTTPQATTPDAELPPNSLDPLPSETFLARLLHPVPLDKFLQNAYLGDKALAIKQPNKEEGRKRIEGLTASLFDLDIEELCEGSASENIHIWVLKPENGKVDSFQVSDSKTAKHCYNLGGCLYFRAPTDLCDMIVPAVSKSVGMNFGGLYEDGAQRGEIETFVSHKGHVTDWHWDFMENWTIQLKGSKKWLLRKGEVQHALRGSTAHYATLQVYEEQTKVNLLGDPSYKFEVNHDQDCEEVTLNPGDVFYFPCGIWHKVISEEDSVSINVSLISTNWADHICNCLRMSLWRDSRFRRPLCFGGVQDARSQMDELMAVARSHLANMPSNDLLPSGLVQVPKKTKILVDVDEPEEEAIKQLSETCALTFSSLGVVFKAEDKATKKQKTNEVSDEWQSDTSTSSGSGLDNYTQYYTHFSYGNPEMTSAMRMKLLVPDFPEPWTQCMSHIVELQERFWKTPQNVSMSEIVENMKKKGGTAKKTGMFEIAKSVVGWLIQSGVMRIVEQPSSVEKRSN
eukprot:Platyproteum_vivax@DN5540_c0_g1_i1.p1